MPRKMGVEGAAPGGAPGPADPDSGLRKQWTGAALYFNKMKKLKQKPAASSSDPSGRYKLLN